MAFLDKLGSFAKSATDKAGETIEVTRINALILAKRKQISDLKSNLGEHIWQCYLSSSPMNDEGANNLCKQIEACEHEIAVYQEQIQGIREKEAEPDVEVVAEATPEPAPEPVPGTCPSCGAIPPEKAVFCSICGAKL